MYLSSVTAVNVRCHEYAHLDCAANVTILSGPNGSGKTSLLEAVHTCALARTFVPVSDTSLIRQGAEVSRLSVEARTDLGTRYRATVEVRDGQRKRISTSEADNASAKDIIGALPVVALSPDHKAITAGTPADRRAFVDGLMAQTSRRVTDVLYEHRRLLKQRNALLAEEVHGDKQLLEVVTQQFVATSAELVERRNAFLADLQPLVAEEYRGVAGESEQVTLRYEPDHVDYSSSQTVVDQLSVASNQLVVAEQHRKRTLFGPQKDEVVFELNGRSVRECASQGQHKSLLVALKLAEARIMQERRNERPVILLDDVFSELDSQRAARVLARMVDLGLQCLVTTTDGESVYNHALKNGATQVVCVAVPGDVSMTTPNNIKAVA